MDDIMLHILLLEMAPVGQCHTPPPTGTQDTNQSCNSSQHKMPTHDFFCHNSMFEGPPGSPHQYVSMTHYTASACDPFDLQPTMVMMHYTSLIAQFYNTLPQWQ